MDFYSGGPPPDMYGDVDMDDPAWDYDTTICFLVHARFLRFSVATGTTASGAYTSRELTIRLILDGLENVTNFLLKGVQSKPFFSYINVLFNQTHSFHIEMFL